MSASDILLSLLAAGLFCYLGYALLYAEEF